MAETTKNKKGFNAVAYALFAGVLVAVVLVIITIFAFTTRYTAFDPEKVAQAYTDTIVQTGDGYNAYKNTLVSKNAKYGDFIRNAYMKPYMNNGDDVKQADFVGTGSDEEAQAIDEVYSTMYDYYVELLTTYGLDDYDAVFSNYFAKLAEVRKQVYGDEYMDDEFMFGAFESNVSQYGRSLTGTDEQIAQDGKTVIQEKTTGKYQEMFGEDYKLTTTVKECTELSVDEVKAYVAEYAQRIKPVAESGAAKADSFSVVDIDDKNKPKTAMTDAFAALDNSESIEGIAKCSVEVTLEDGTVVAVQEVYVVQIGNSWYVDDTNVDTSALYLALA
ncbi:MAG: hypothetical protein K2L19_02575 [Eubacterium sp.]|nr:hypothetical protein [Eubacterium sp.]